MSAAWDVAVVGGGHNALVCAGLLAKKGRRVVLLEAADAVGGAAVTREFAPGFRVSAGAHILHQLHPRVVSALGLRRHGLAVAVGSLATTALDPGGAHLVLGDAMVTRRTLGAHSGADAAALPAFTARLQRFARVLASTFTRVPPRLGTGAFSDLAELARTGLAVRRLGREDMRELLRIGAMNVADLLEDAFGTDLLRGALALDAVLGTRLGPRSPGSVFTLLHRMAGEAGTRAGTGSALSLPRGGMGAVTAAMAAAARAAGVEIRTGAPVARIALREDRAAGVVLESGEEIGARVVVSGADPRTTFLDLVGPAELDAGFVRRVRNIRMRGTAAKLHLALNGRPEFAGVGPDALAGRLVVSPGIDYLEDAFNHAKYGEYSERPALEITLPSVADPALAPSGRHVLSAVVQYAPYDLAAGWDASRDAFADRVMAVLEQAAPGIGALTLAREVVTPLDLERDFRMAGGHWHHGEIGFDQMMMMRPLPGIAQYATQIPGLYLCGAGCHPGGGVAGVAGMNAARRILHAEANP